MTWRQFSERISPNGDWLNTINSRYKNGVHMTKKILMALGATVIFALLFPWIYSLVNTAGGEPASVVVSSVIFFIAMMAVFTVSSRKKR